MDLDVEAAKAKLEQLKMEHRDLDEIIARLTEQGPVDQLQIDIWGQTANQWRARGLGSGRPLG